MASLRSNFNHNLRLRYFTVSMCARRCGDVQRVFVIMSALQILSKSDKLWPDIWQIIFRAIRAVNPESNFSKAGNDSARFSSTFVVRLLMKQFSTNQSTLYRAERKKLVANAAVKVLENLRMENLKTLLNQEKIFKQGRRRLLRSAFGFCNAKTSILLAPVSWIN